MIYAKIAIPAILQEQYVNLLLNGKHLKLPDCLHFPCPLTNYGRVASFNKFVTEVSNRSLN